MTARGVEDRIKHMAANPPGVVGRCAETVWHALDVPALGTPDANAVVRVMRQHGKLQSGGAPRGA